MARDNPDIQGPDGEYLTLRDYFAAAALTGIVADGNAGRRHEHYGPTVGAVMDAYEYADAMLRKRNHDDRP